MERYRRRAPGRPRQTGGRRKETDTAIAAYQQQRAQIDASRLSTPLQAALAAIEKRVVDLPTLRQTVYSQVDETLGVQIMDAYRGFRSDLSAVLRLLIDATTNDVVVRKLGVLPKLMLAGKAITDVGGMIFYYHQLRAEKSSRKFSPSEALSMVNGANLSEIYWQDVIALSQGDQRSHLVAIHDSQEWQGAVELIRVHGQAALGDKEPPIPSEKE